MQAAGHRAQLDSVRFLAFLGVFVYHFDDRTFAYGSLGVQLFFVLSGFLITRLLLLNESGDLRHDLGVFYARRTLRIFPLYYLVLLVLLLAGRLPHPWYHFLYLHNVWMFLEPHQTPGPTGHFWSLSVEEQLTPALSASAAADPDPLPAAPAAGGAGGARPCRAWP